MTKKQLTEKWTQERSKAAGEASKLNVKLAGLNQRAVRMKNDRQGKTAMAHEIIKTKNLLGQMVARVVTIDQFLKDI